MSFKRKETIMIARLIPALVAVCAVLSPSIARSDDDKKPTQPAEPSQLILSQYDDETKKPKKPKDESPGVRQIVAQSDDEPKKPKKPESPDLTQS